MSGDSELGPTCGRKEAIQARLATTTSSASLSLSNGFGTLFWSRLRHENGLRLSLSDRTWGKGRVTMVERETLNAQRSTLNAQGEMRATHRPSADVEPLLYSHWKSDDVKRRTRDQTFVRSCSSGAVSPEWSGMRFASADAAAELQGTVCRAGRVRRTRAASFGPSAREPCGMRRTPGDMERGEVFSTPDFFGLSLPSFPSVRYTTLRSCGVISCGGSTKKEKQWNIGAYQGGIFWRQARWRDFSSRRAKSSDRP